MSAPQNLHPEDIKAEIRKTGTNLKALSLANDLSINACRLSLVRPIPRANQAIAGHLNKRLHDLWPEWFDDHGRKKYLKGQPSRKHADTATPNATAA